MKALWGAWQASNGVAYVDNEKGRSVTAIDTKTGETATGAGAHAIAFAVGGLAYVTNQGADSVSAIDPTSKAVVKTIAVGHKPNGMVWRSK